VTGPFGRWLAIGLAAANLAALAFACDDGDFVPTPGVTSGRAPVSLDAGPFVPPTPPCEAAVVGEACPNDPVVCETGPDPNPTCNRRIRCGGIAWQDDVADASCAAGCPAAYDPDRPDACGIPLAGTLRCEYPDEGFTCGCARARKGADAGDAADAGNASDAGYVWTCVEATATCPSTRPHVGAPCVVPMTCDYGACVFDDGPSMRCLGGFWDLAPGVPCQAP
jgi:hypothetical protein